MEVSSLSPPANFADLLLDAICMVDAEGRIVFISAASERIFGYSQQEMIGKSILDLLHPDDRQRTMEQVGKIMSGQLQTDFENRYLRKDGRVVHIRWTARWSEKDHLRVAVAHDISERKRAETLQAALYAISEAAHTAEDLASLYEQIHRIIGDLLPADNLFVALQDEASDLLHFPYYVDTYGRVPTSQHLYSGVLSAEVIRSGRTLLLTPDTVTTLPEWLQVGIAELSHDWLGVPLKTQRGTLGALVVQSYAGDVRYREQDRELLQYVSTQIAAAIERKQMLTRLRYIAEYDQLTKLPNRQLLQDRLQTALAWARRENAQLAVLYLDLDKFKLVNDSFGHATGDHLLAEVAQRLQGCVREADTVARMGGDEFVVLLQSVQLPKYAAAVAEKILQALNQPFEIAEQTLQFRPSIGGALFPMHGLDAEHLLQQADAAMYQAKNSGGNRFQLAAAATQATTSTSTSTES